jgi:allantoicase
VTDFTELPDLAADRVGGAVLVANDEFFAEKENLLKPAKPVFDEHAYTDRGKLMDGWETRRRRTPGHDWCIVKLGMPGKIRGFTVDTSFFRGNFPEECSIEAAEIDGDPEPAALAEDQKSFREVLPRTKLEGDSRNVIALPAPVEQRFTHLRFRIYPDGGVARLRVHGEVVPDWKRLTRFGGLVDLAALENGGVVVTCNDMFFGSRHNLIMPGRSVNMGDGWETKRKRRPGHDWVIVKLGARGIIRRVEVDTNHFKGNFPESAMLEGIDASSDGPTAVDLTAEERVWGSILPRTKLRAHTRHFYDDAIAEAGPVTHVRMNIYPDGGVSRLRLFGELAP